MKKLIPLHSVSLVEYSYITKSSYYKIYTINKGIFSRETIKVVSESSFPGCDVPLKSFEESRAKEYFIKDDNIYRKAHARITINNGRIEVFNFDSNEDLDKFLEQFQAITTVKF